jgi:hypothetical protein
VGDGTDDMLVVSDDFESGEAVTWLYGAEKHSDEFDTFSLTSSPPSQPSLQPSAVPSETPSLSPTVDCIPDATVSTSG